MFWQKALLRLQQFLNFAEQKMYVTNFLNPEKQCMLSTHLKTFKTPAKVPHAGETLE